jgi:2'-5' RNA ligase
MRLFLACDLPSHVRAELDGIQKRLAATTAGWRWVPPEGIHLTLRFLGEVRPERDLELRATWRETARPFPRVRFRLEGTGVFPAPARPRILWIGLQEEPPSGILEALAAALETAAREHGFAQEARAFRPHLTLARVLDGARPSAVAAPIAVSGIVECPEIVLFESHLGRSGARYTALETFPLAGSPS